MRRPGPKSKSKNTAPAPKKVDLGDSYGSSSGDDEISSISGISERSTRRTSTRYGSAECGTGSEDSQNSVPAERSPPTISNAAATTQVRREEPIASGETKETFQREKTGAIKRKPRSPTTAGMRGIKLLQLSEALMIPKANFARLVREILQENSSEVTRMSLGALEALHVATETYMEQRFADAYLLSLHRGRMTLTVKDLALAGYLRGH